MGSEPFAQQRDSGIGVALIAGSAVAYSTAGFFTRLIHVDLWTLIFWRGLFSTAFLLAAAHIQHGRSALRPFRELDRWGWVAAGFSTAAMFCYLAALRNTSVANVAIIYGTAPFVTAAVALIALGERTTLVTLWCSAVALIGIALMFAGSSASNALDGELLALGMTVLMALMIIAIRRSTSASSLPIAAISSLASSTVAAPARTSHRARPPAIHRARAVRDHATRARAAAAHRWHETPLGLPCGLDRRARCPVSADLGLDRVRRDPKPRHRRRRTNSHRGRYPQHAAVEPPAASPSAAPRRR